MQTGLVLVGRGKYGRNKCVYVSVRFLLKLIFIVNNVLALNCCINGLLFLLTFVYRVISLKLKPRLNFVERHHNFCVFLNLTHPHQFKNKR